MKKRYYFIIMGIILAQTGFVPCFAQKSGEKLFLIEGHFFEGMPSGMTFDRVSGLSLIKDGDGHSAVMLQLKEGEVLSEETLSFHIPADSVPGGEVLLELAIGKQKLNAAVGKTSTVNTVTLSDWVGKPFPDFKVTDTSGHVWTKHDILGKPFVLNFWHTGCGPCIKEMPDLNEWMKICPDVTYFSTTWNSARQIEKIVTSTPFLFTHIADNLFFFQTFKVQVTPTTVLVDKKGVIRYWEQGTSETKRQNILNHLIELTKE